MQLKLKVLKTQKRSKPYDIAKLKNSNIREKLQVEITNKFQALTDECEIEQEWNVFKDVVLKATDNTVGKRRGTRREQWIKPETWDLIDKRRNIKMRRDTERGMQQQMSIEYSRLDKCVKMSCKRDKKLWLETKCQEAQDASNRNDTRTLYRISKELGGNGTRSMYL